MREIRQFSTLPVATRQAIAAGSTRTLCPTCGGGRRLEVSLSIRAIEVPGLIKLSCFRSTCDWYCTVATGSDVVVQTVLTQATHFTDDTRALAHGDIIWRLRRDYCLDTDKAQAHGWVTTEDGRALVLPILDPYGRLRGHITRTFDTPKRVFTYKATAQPWLDWWPGDGKMPVVVVEDCLSACRLAGLGFCAVALLGTSISVPQAKEIEHIAVYPVYLALDRDAYVKSLKLVARHAHIVKMLPVCLTEDIKNMSSDDDIVALFGGASNG